MRRESRTYIKCLYFAIPNHVIANARCGASYNDMIIDFGRLGPESLALLRTLFCIIDQPDKWVTESVAGDADHRIVT